MIICIYISYYTYTYWFIPYLLAMFIVYYILILIGFHTIYYMTMYTRVSQYLLVYPMKNPLDPSECHDGLTESLHHPPLSQTMQDLEGPVLKAMQKHGVFSHDIG